MKHKSIVFYIFSTFVFLCIFEIQLHAQSYKVETIITEETELFPESDLRISTIFGHDLSINNTGDIVFCASLRNTPNGSSPSGIIFFSNGETKLLVKGNRTSTVSEDEFRDVSSPDINDNGTIVFCGTLFLPGDVTSQSIYKIVENNPIPVISFGDSVNGLEATIQSVDCFSRGLSLNNNGDIAFNATLSNGRRGLFLFTDEGGIEPVILAGDPFSVFKGNEILVFANIPVINDLGEIVFLARFMWTDGIRENQTNTASGVFLFSEGVIVPVKLPGAEAPGTNGNVFWDEHISWMTLGNNSEVVYRGDYLIPGGDENVLKDRRGMGLFLWTESDTNPLILTGDIVPETEGRFLFYKGTLTKDAINDQGEIAASFATRDKGGVFLISDEDIVPVFLTQNPPAGMEEVIFTGTSAINNRGDIVFFGRDIFNTDKVFLAIKEE